MSLADLLPWGLAWDDLDGAAWTAARISRSRLLNDHDRHDAALDEITLLVATSPDPLTRRSLVDAGIAGINSADNTYRHHHGLYEHSARPGWRHAVYWRSAGVLASPFEDKVDERLTLGAVWDQMRERDRETFSTLAEHGGHASAARSLGHTYSTWASRIQWARDRARALWADWEAPAKHYGHDGGWRPGTQPGAASARYRSRINSRRTRRRKAA